ncbi:hypothetical protein NPIL_55941 [Nephila pilipes]|uniref:Uncharacterized protein n=1 Tax=Nephila pilipes TaxID=299642 RepID=A0A8X6NXG2_NEPPI|nr:hypothetical protein NPIL_55941 [Nephila pilipes]
MRSETGLSLLLRIIEKASLILTLICFSLDSIPSVINNSLCSWSAMETHPSRPSLIHLARHDRVVQTMSHTLTPGQSHARSAFLEAREGGGSYISKNQSIIARIPASGIDAYNPMTDHECNEDSNETQPLREFNESHPMVLKPCALNKLEGRKNVTP